jgi:hypothetical protein
MGETYFHQTLTIVSKMFTLQFLNLLAYASVVIGAPNSIDSRASSFKYLITLSVVQFLNLSQYLTNIKAVILIPRPVSQLQAPSPQSQIQLATLRSQAGPHPGATT